MGILNLNLQLPKDIEFLAKFPVVINRKDEPSIDVNKPNVIDIEIIINFDIIIVWYHLHYGEYDKKAKYSHKTLQDTSFIWNNPPDPEIMELIIEKLTECIGLDACIGVLELFATKQ